MAASERILPDSVSARSGLTWLLLAVALGSALFCFWLLYQQPRGDFEFAYAPYVAGPLPWAPTRGFTWEQLWSHVYRAALLTPALSLLGLVIAALWPRLRISAERVLPYACALGVSFSAFLMLAVLRGRALLDDELVYRMQGGIYADGQLQASNLRFTPVDVFSVAVKGGYSGKYFPGEPLLQIPGMLLGVPALLHLPLFALTLWMFHRALRLTASAPIAAWATTFLALSPMVTFTTATGLTQAAALCLTTAAGLGYVWLGSGKPRLGALLVGGAFAVNLLVRPQVAIPANGIVGLMAAIALYRERKWGALGLLAVGAGFGCALAGLYCWRLTGSPLKPPWFLTCPVEHYGFGRVWRNSAFEHTFGTALENLGVVAARFNGWWLGWPLGLLVVPLWLGLGRPLAGCRIWLVIALAIVAFEFPYYATGISDTGVVYHYEIVLAACVVLANVVEAAARRAPGLAYGLLVSHVLLGTTSFYVEQGLRVRRLITAIHRDADAALSQIPGRALLFHEVWPSERHVLGWMFDSFPERFRRDADRVVTFPRMSPGRVAEIRALYPDRACYYFHLRHDTERAELLKCEEATAYLAREFEEDPARASLWERPTSYRKGHYDPGAFLRAQQLRKNGTVVVPCCLNELLEAVQYPHRKPFACSAER